MNAHMTRRQFYIPDPLWQAVQRMAEHETGSRGRKVHAADVVREALEAHVARWERKRRTG
jgi:hypothetical protein